MIVSRLFRRSDDGIAMITAVLSSAIILTLSITAAALAIHNTEQSGLDRGRTQDVAAAEGGIDVIMSTLQTTPTGQLPCTLTGTTTISPTQSFTASINYYDVAGTWLNQSTCSPASWSTPPDTAVITSTAAPSLVPGSSKRTMQSKIRMRPVYGGLANAIFSDNSPTMRNNLTVTGTTSDNANVYTNGSWSCANPGTVQGAIYATGSADGVGGITLANNCQASQDIWAYGPITMQNSALVGHNAISSTSSISLFNSAHILNAAVAGTTITINGGQAHIDGTQTPNHPQTGPPPLPFPHILYDNDAITQWTAQPPDGLGYTINNYSTCSGSTSPIPFLSTMTASTPKTVLRVTPACTLTLSSQALGKSTINLYSDLAIVTDGPVALSNVTFQSGDGGDHKLQFIVPWTTATSAACGTANSPNFSTNNQVTLQTLQIFVYTPCTVTINNNSAGDGAQIYGGTVNITNQFTLTFRSFQIPGAGGITGYNVDIAYIREIVNP
jgi:hypothetical protein